MDMNDTIKDLMVFGRIMGEKGIDAFGADPVDAENRLYSCFGMSSDEIMELFNVNNFR